MGKNYYARKIPTATQKLTMVTAIMNNKMGELERMIPSKVHIGKSSAGWQFLFDHNNDKYYNRDKQSLKKYLAKCEIFDEYGRPITVKDFWQMVENKKNDRQGHILVDDISCKFANFD